MRTEQLAVPGVSLPPHVIHRALASLDQAVVAIDLCGQVLASPLSGHIFGLGPSLC